MTKDRNQGDKHDSHAEREALSSLGTNNHLLTGALHGRRGTTDTRSRSSNRSASGQVLLPPMLPTMSSTRAGGQGNQSHRSQSQSSQASRGQEQRARLNRQREREQRDRDFTRRERNQRLSTRTTDRGQASSSRLHRQSSSHSSGPSAGAGSSTLRRQSTLHSASGSSRAGPSNVQRSQGILRQDPRPTREPRPEDRFIRPGGRGFRCILCESRDQSYRSMQYCRSHVIAKHSDALPNRDSPMTVYNCPHCDFVSHERKGVNLHITLKHKRRGG